MTLYRRDRHGAVPARKTGKGGLVSSSLLANGLWANACLVQSRLFGEPVPPRPPREQRPNALTNALPLPRRPLAEPGLDQRGQAVRAASRSPGLPGSWPGPPLRDPEARRANSHALVEVLDARFALRDLAEWRPLLDAAGVTFSDVSTLDDIPNDAQMRAAGALVPFEEGPGLTVSSPFTVHGTPKAGPRLAPALGEHTLALLREAGYGEEEISRLRERGIVSG